MKFWVLLISRLAVGGFFVFSGIVKLFPVESFELSLVETGTVPWPVAPYLARMLVALEIFLGVAVVIPTSRVMLYLRAMLVLTLFFSIYLVFLWWSKGDAVNCGCFGGYFYMTPSESLLKNALLILTILGILRFQDIYSKSLKWIVLTLGVISIALPFVINPISFERQFPGEEEFPYRLQSELFPEHVHQALSFDPLSDTCVIAFMSTTCSHCRTGARRLAFAYDNKDLPPIHLFMIGPREAMPEFMKESTSKFPYTFYGENSFFQFCDGVLPTLLYIENGQVFNKWQGYDIDYKAFDWIEEREEKTD